MSTKFENKGSLSKNNIITKEMQVNIVESGRCANFPYSPARDVYLSERAPFKTVTIGNVVLFVAVSELTNKVAILNTGVKYETT